VLVKHYCTYFDSNYLPQGLVLAESLQRFSDEGVVWVLALDDRAVALLKKISRTNIRVVQLNELLNGDADLAQARATRSRREFIFTLTACWIRFLLSQHREIKALAYVDADLCFFSSPQAAWDELAHASVLIVPHRYPSWHDDSAWYGRYNVGWLIFRNDAVALACLQTWRKECLESCALTGDGRQFGDQKYLDTWPERFGEAVRVSTHPGVNLAPWNWAGHVIEREDDMILVDRQPLIVFHFAQFRRVNARWWDSGQLEYGVMPGRVARLVYGPYAAALRKAEDGLARTDPSFVRTGCGWRAALGGSVLLKVLRLGFGQYWREENGAWSFPRLAPGVFSGRLLAVYRRWQRRVR